MAIRRLKTVLPKECYQPWEELGQILAELKAVILSAEAGGANMDNVRADYTLLCHRFCLIGTEHYPAQFGEFCAACDLTLPELVKG